MTRFQIPQFIEQKPKIIGPLTLAQFFYVGGGGAVSVLAFYTLPGFLAFLVLVVAGGVGVSLAFIKINGQELPKIILSALQFWQKPKTYVWKREIKTVNLDVSSIEKIEALRRNMSLQAKIKSAFKNITTGTFLKKEKEQKEQYQVVRYLTGEKRMAKRVDYSEGGKDDE